MFVDSSVPVYDFRFIESMSVISSVSAEPKEKSQNGVRLFFGKGYCGDSEAFSDFSCEGFSVADAEVVGYHEFWF